MIINNKHLLAYLLSFVLFTFNCDTKPFSVNSDIFITTNDEIYISGYYGLCGCNANDGYIKIISSSIDIPIQDMLWSIAVDSNGNIFAGSLDVVHILDTNYNDYTLPLNNAISSLCISNTDTAYFVGSNGFFAKYQNDTLTTINAGTTSNLITISCPADNNILIGGESGTLLAYDGNNTIQISNTSGLDFTDISYVNQTSFYLTASGSESGGILYYFNGTTLQEKVPSNSNGFLGVKAISDNEVYIVGGKRTFFHPDGIGGLFHYQNGNLEMIQTVPETFLWQVDVTSNGSVHVVGPGPTYLIF